MDNEVSIEDRINATARRIVDQGVILCASAFVSQWEPTGDYSEEDLSDLWRGPIDREEALLDNDWYQDAAGEWMHNNYPNDTMSARDAFDLMDHHWPNFDPDDYMREVFEHWIVDRHMADELRSHGETVVDDIYGWSIWSRTTTGQSICMDRVIREIAAEWIQHEEDLKRERREYLQPQTTN